MELTKIQKKKVEEILKYYCDGEKEVTFKAPTGSGKTFMIANFISEVIRENKNKRKLCFVMATLSSAELPLQLKNKFEDYQKYLGVKFQTVYEESPSSKNIKGDAEIKILPEENKVIIFGKSSFGKDRIFIENGIFKSFLDQVKTQEYKLIYIRDEAHSGAEKTIELHGDPKRFEDMIQEDSSFVIKMTATPRESKNLIELFESDLNDETNNKYLLKTMPKFNIGIESDNDIIDDSAILFAAIKEFKKIKEEYKNDQYAKHVNPAMLIQVDSENKNNKKEWNVCFEWIKKELKKNAISFCVYFGNEKYGSLKEDVSLQSISKINSGYDCVIFKVGPATGWDIPRACMLVQLRNVSSTILNTQTIGRIKRNPNPHFLEKNTVMDSYYVYTNYQESTKNMHSYKLIEKYSTEKFPAIRLVENETKKHNNDKEFLEDVSELLKSTRTQFSEKKSEFNKKNIDFCTEILITSDNKQIERTKKRIYNSLDLEIEVKRFINNEKKLYEKIKKIIDDEYNRKNSDFKYSIYHYLFILFKNYWVKIKELYASEFKPENYCYQIEEYSLPTNYSIWAKKDCRNNDIIIDYKNCSDIYMYKKIGKAENAHKQVLDSQAEINFMKKLLRKIKEWKDEEMECKISLWTKNPTLGNKVYIEYINESKCEISKAYLDFIIKINNMFLYVEVKSVNDYDPKKTKSIADSLKEITNKKNIANNLFICIVHMPEDHNNDEVISQVYSSNKNFKNEKNQSIIAVIKSIYDISTKQ